MGIRLIVHSLSFRITNMNTNMNSSSIERGSRSSKNSSGVVPPASGGLAATSTKICVTVHPASGSQVVPVESGGNSSSSGGSRSSERERETCAISCSTTMASLASGDHVVASASGSTSNNSPSRQGTWIIVDGSNLTKGKVHLSKLDKDECQDDWKSVEKMARFLNAGIILVGKFQILDNFTKMIRISSDILSTMDYVFFTDSVVKEESDDVFIHMLYDKYLCSGERCYVISDDTFSWESRGPNVDWKRTFNVNYNGTAETIQLSDPNCEAGWNRLKSRKNLDHYQFANCAGFASHVCGSPMTCEANRMCSLKAHLRDAEAHVMAARANIDEIIAADGTYTYASANPALTAHVCSSPSTCSFRRLCRLRSADMALEAAETLASNAAEAIEAEEAAVILAAQQKAADDEIRATGRCPGTKNVCRPEDGYVCIPCWNYRNQNPKKGDQCSH